MGGLQSRPAGRLGDPREVVAAIAESYYRSVKISEDSPARLIVVCHQTVWIAVLPGLMGILIAAIAISQGRLLLLWSAAGFVIFGWFFIRRDWLEIRKIDRRVAFFSLRPLGLQTTYFGFDDIKDVTFEVKGISFRPVLVTFSGMVPLTAWYSQGSPLGQENTRVRILIALGKVRSGLL
jgi:hypothetical protein